MPSKNCSMIRGASLQFMMTATRVPINIARTTGNTPLMPADAQTTPFANSSFGGPHTGLVQFVFVDGSVKGVKTTASLETLSRLVNRADGQVIDGYY